MSAIRISWGTRIALLYIGFVLLIVTLVIGSMRQQFDLVSQEYYEDELKYQEIIDAGRNQSVLSQPVLVSVLEGGVRFQFPNEFQGITISGNVEFYSPVSADLDKTFAIDMGNEREMTIPVEGFRTGAYNVRLRWVAEGRSYYQETTIKLLP